MRNYDTERLIESGYLNEDDVKILKHLQSIDNIFKRKKPNISHLFAFAGKMVTCIELNGEEWCFDSFINIPCDGGDPDGTDLHQEGDLSELLDEIIE